MDSHVYKKASFRLPALSNIAVLRFNTRGTSSIRGTSEGVFDGGFAGEEGLRRNPEVCTRARPAEPLAGRLVLRHRAGAQVRARIRERVHRRYSALPAAAPRAPAELDEWNKISNPLYALVPEHDDYLQPPAARERFAAVPRTRVIPSLRGASTCGWARSPCSRSSTPWSAS